MSVVKRLYRNFDSFIVDIKDWEILDQGVTALWGASGAGKSTVISILLGLDEEAELDWQWGEEQLNQLIPPKRNLGVVFQKPGLFPHMTVRDNIMFPVQPKLHSHWEQDFEFLVSHLNIEKLLNSPCSQLSGGEAQRVALARSLIYRPRLLILDEPFSSLDIELRNKSRDLLKELNQRLNCPVLLVTHDPQDVEVLANKISYIEMGKITKEETLKG